MQLKSLEDTQNFSKKISKIISAGDIIFLYGEIGTGKTTWGRHTMMEVCRKSCGGCKPSKVSIL